MKKCPNCDGELRDDATVCQYCNSPVPLVIPPVLPSRPREIKTNIENPLQIPVPKNGTSQTEHEWFEEQFDDIIANQDEQVRLLGKISGSLTFIVIIIILGILITLFRGCTGI
jgi:hypothetical protein